MADPAGIQYGRVVGRFVAYAPAAADAPATETPRTGSVTLTPRVPMLHIVGATPPRLALIEKLVCPVVDGWLCAPGTTTPGVRIAATVQSDTVPGLVQWRAEFQVGVRGPAPVVFNVPAGGEVDLSQIVPVEPVTPTITVVSHADAQAAAASAAAADAAAARVDQIVAGLAAGGIPAPYVEHNQATPSASWVVAHPFIRTPQVSVVVDGQLVVTDVEYLTGLVSVTFATPTTGKVILT